MIISKVFSQAPIICEFFSAYWSKGTILDSVVLWTTLKSDHDDNTIQIKNVMHELKLHWCMSTVVTGLFLPLLSYMALLAIVFL